MFAVKMLIKVALFLLCAASATIAKEHNLCRSFSGTFSKTAQPQTLTIFADFDPYQVTIGDEYIYVKKDNCPSEKGNYSCRVIKVHEQGFWRFEIDGIVTYNVDSVILSADLKGISAVVLRALPLSDSFVDHIFFQASAPFVICPQPNQKSVNAEFVFPATVLNKNVKVSFTLDGRQACEIGQGSIIKCENVSHDRTGTVLTVSFAVTRFQAPSKRYRTVTAIVVQGGSKTLLTKMVDFGSTVWDPLCKTYDGTFSFLQDPTNITAYMPFQPKEVIIGDIYTFNEGKCKCADELLECKLTNVPGSNIFKFEIFNVSKRDIQAIRFSNMDADSPKIYIIYRKMLTSLPQFLFSPEFSAPFVHCPKPSSYDVDISCATFYTYPSNVTVLKGNTVLCNNQDINTPNCRLTQQNLRTSVKQHVYKTSKTERFVFITCELMVKEEKGYMTHLIDYGRKDAYEIGKDDIDESWSHLGLVYNGTYQRNSTAGHFNAFMDFKPKSFRWFWRMDGENCFAGSLSFPCKVRKVIGSSFWRVEVNSVDSLRESKLFFDETKSTSARRYTMHSTPWSDEVEGLFLLKLSQPFVHDAKNCSTVSIRCAFLHTKEGEHVKFKVYTKYRTICGIGHQDLAPCKHVIFDNNAGTVTVTVDVYRGDINGERYGIFTCQSENIEDLHHVVDFGVETPTA